MKIIACIPFRNEEVFLPICLSSLQGVADEILGYDDGSTDNSVQIFESFGGLVKKGKEIGGEWAAGGEATVRNTLLQWGRERGATHFLWIDADEALSTQFRITARERIEQLPSGHKLALHLLALWKSPYMYRNDASVWSSHYTDFAVHDDPSLPGLQGFLHLGRTQGVNTDDNWHKVPLSEGPALHFQFCSWQRFQMKQCWYRCVELVKFPSEFERINSVYSITLDSPEEYCSPVLAKWTEGLPISENLESLPPAWQFSAILDMFEKHGVRFFEPLQIWHVPELRDIFVREVGCEPRTPEECTPLAAKIKSKLKSALPKPAAMKHALKSVLPESILSVIRNIRKASK